MRLKILTVCRGGRVRSVGVRYWLHDRSGIPCDVIAVGAEANSAETIAMLAEWSDWIVICSTNIAQTLCANIASLEKSVVLDLGGDVWGNAVHPDLQEKIACLMIPFIQKMTAKQ